MATPQIQIISPHQDDAAFSLGSVLAELSRCGISVMIVNCLTVSGYAPFSALKTPRAVSRLRHCEDVEFAGRLGANTSIIDLGCLDAPLRLGTACEHVCGLRPAFDPARRNLSRKLRDVLGAAPAILPLGLGGHVDHVLARDEALLAGGSPLAFYEELPYAYRSADVDREARDILSNCGMQAFPHLCGATGAAFKRKLIGAYRSQASSAGLDQITSYRGGTERLWMTSEFEKTWLNTVQDLK